MLLYRELDNLESEEALVQFEAGLADRFGKLPPESIELIEVVRLRWAAIQLGMEKIILKKPQNGLPFYLRSAIDVLPVACVRPDTALRANPSPNLPHERRQQPVVTNL